VLFFGSTSHNGGRKLAKVIDARIYLHHRPSTSEAEKKGQGSQGYNRPVSSSIHMDSLVMTSEVSGHTIIIDPKVFNFFLTKNFSESRSEVVTIEIRGDGEGEVYRETDREVKGQEGEVR
jgi:hypothetical protein